MLPRAALAPRRTWPLGDYAPSLSERSLRDRRMFASFEGDRSWVMIPVRCLMCPPRVRSGPALSGNPDARAHGAGHRRRIVRSSRAPAACPHAGPAARVRGSARAGRPGRRRLRQVRHARALAGNPRLAGGRRPRHVGPDPGDRALHRAEQPAGLQSTCSSSWRATRRRSPRWAPRSPRSRCIDSRVSTERGATSPADGASPAKRDRLRWPRRA